MGNFQANWLIHVRIRKAIETDLPAMEWNGEYAHFRHMFAQAYSQARQGTTVIWIMEIPGIGCIGQAIVQLTCSRPELADGFHRAYLYGFRIKPKYRGQGLGKQVIDHIESDLLKRNFRILTLNVAKNNRRAQSFYRECGFSSVADEPGIWSYIDQHGEVQTVVEPAWRMEKRLV